MKTQIVTIIGCVALLFTAISVCEDYYFDNASCPDKKDVRPNEEYRYELSAISMTYHYWEDNAWKSREISAADTKSDASVEPSGGAGKSRTDYVVRWGKPKRPCKGSVTFRLSPVEGRTGTVTDNVALDGYRATPEDDS